jgi:hypothetical protein
MLSHGRSLTALVIFYAVLSIPVIGPPIMAMVVIGLALGGRVTTGRPLTQKEIDKAKAHVARRKAERLAKLDLAPRGALPKKAALGSRTAPTPSKPGSPG